MTRARVSWLPVRVNAGPQDDSCTQPPEMMASSSSATPIAETSRIFPGRR